MPYEKDSPSFLRSESKHCCTWGATHAHAHTSRYGNSLPFISATALLLLLLLLLLRLLQVRQRGREKNQGYRPAVSARKVAAPRTEHKSATWRLTLP